MSALYLLSAVFIAQVLVGPSKQLKQIFQIEHNIVKNASWSEANQSETLISTQDTQVPVNARLQIVV